MSIIEVTAENFAIEREKAFDKGDIVIFKFGSEYCDPCHALGFELEDLEEDMLNKVDDIIEKVSQKGAEVLQNLNTPEAEIVEDANIVEEETTKA